MNMHKKHQIKITQKLIKRELSFLYVTHRHDLFYITEKLSKYFKRYSSYRAGMKIFTDVGRTDGRRTDPRLIAISLEPFGRWKMINVPNYMSELTIKHMKCV